MKKHETPHMSWCLQMMSDVESEERTEEKECVIGRAGNRTIRPLHEILQAASYAWGDGGDGPIKGNQR